MSGCFNNTRKMEVPTQEGIFFMEGPVEGKRIKELQFDDKLDNFRIPEKQQAALADIAESSDGMVFIVHNGDKIVGYVSFHNPDICTRWNKHSKILELGAIEISPDFRNNKFGVKLLKFAFQEPVMEDRIVITTEYCWHWDLENTNMDLWSYQKMLSRLFGSVGLVKTETDDPDILEHAANVLMVRFGKNISNADIEKFKSLQFACREEFPYAR